MKILVHDFSGHPFQVQLSRALSNMNFDVLHLFSESFNTPKGNLKKNTDDQITFNVKGIVSERGFDKYSYTKRIFQEIEYSRKLIKEIYKFKPDVVLSSNAPLLVQNRTQKYCSNANCKFIFWLQDLYGIAILNVFKNKLFGIGRLIGLYSTMLEARILQKSDHIVIITEDFRDLLTCKYKINNANIHTIPNWAPIDEIKIYPKNNDWSIKNKYHDKFCIVYSGTLGLKHDPSLILNAARAFVEEKEVVFIVISEGLGATWLETEKRKHGLSNLDVMSYLPFDTLPLALSTADILIAILENSSGIYSVPSKVLTYHCAGKPIVLSVPKANLASRIVSDNRTGIVVEPNNIKEFVNALKILYGDSKLRNEYGLSARRYAEKHYDIKKIALRFSEIIN